MKPKSKVLIIAGSDSSGGAGIQADIKTVTTLGSYAMTAITAVTIQNTTGVKSIVAIDPKEILNQIIFTSKDIKPNAIKIGMLHSTNVIRSVVSAITKLKVKNIPFSLSDRNFNREIFKRYCDTTLAKSELGFKPKISLEEGIIRISNNKHYTQNW